MPWWEREVGIPIERMTGEWRAAWVLSRFVSDRGTEGLRAYALLCHVYGEPFLASDRTTLGGIILPKRIAEKRKKEGKHWSVVDPELDAKYSTEALMEKFIEAILD